jgi:uncharacterized membrane protein
MKAATYRVVGYFVTSLVAYVFTGSLALAASIGFADMTIKVFGYYVHERLWDRIRWGRRRHLQEDYTI